MKRIDGEIAAQTGTLGAQVKASLLQRYETTVEQARRIEADLTREFAELQKQGLNFATLYNQALALTRDIDQERKELDALRERLSFFAAEKNSLGFVRLVTPALAPDLPYGPGKKKLLLLLLAAALCVALTLRIALDLADRRIHTVNDAERALSIPALGWTLEQGDAATRMFAEDQLSQGVPLLLPMLLQTHLSLRSLEEAIQTLGYTRQEFLIQYPLSQQGVEQRCSSLREKNYPVLQSLQIEKIKGQCPKI